MRAKLLALLPTLALSLAACGDDPLDRTDPLLREVQFSYQTTGYEWFIPVPTAAAASEDGDVVVRGQFTSPLVGTRLEARERREGARIELRVNAVSVDVCGAAGTRNHVYTAVHDAGGPGTYRIRVVHTLDDQPWPGGDATYEAEVRVR